MLSKGTVAAVQDHQPTSATAPLQVKRMSSMPPGLFGVCGRSGHTASVLAPGGREYCLLFGGASTGYSFRGDCDLVAMGSGEQFGPLIVFGAPPARWLHSAVVASVKGSKEGVVVFGGQGAGNTLHDDLFMLELEFDSASAASDGLELPTIQAERIEEGCGLLSLYGHSATVYNNHVCLPLLPLTDVALCSQLTHTV